MFEMSFNYVKDMTINFNTNHIFSFPHIQRLRLTDLLVREFIQREAQDVCQIGSCVSSMCYHHQSLGAQILEFHSIEVNHLF